MAAYEDRPMDQAHRLRQLVAQGLEPPPAAERRAHTIAVASGKGGVGKTLVSVNLAIALAARGHRVMLFDLDMGLANADIVLGLDVSWTLSDVLSGRRSLEEVIIAAPGDIAFVPGSSGVAGMANLSEFERHQLLSVLHRVEAAYDVILLDCGAGISRNVVAFGAAADTLLIIATPEPTAITDAYATIKAFVLERHESRHASSAAAGSIGVVVNLAENRQEGRQVYERLASVAARFLHVPVTDYGYILRDDHVPAAVRARTPLLVRYPRSSASACMLASAARLSAELGQPQMGDSLFSRVMRMFV
jgi:flagellar biosynthesis protein FlhG